MNNRDSHTNPVTRDDRSRVVGFYLLYIAGLIIALGLAGGIILNATGSMSAGGAGPSAPTEPAIFVRNSVLISAGIIGLGVLVGAFALYRVFKPDQNQSNQH